MSLKTKSNIQKLAILAGGVFAVNELSKGINRNANVSTPASLLQIDIIEKLKEDAELMVILKGPNGIQGPTGANGIQGIPGPNGIQGITGANGIQGLTGPNGIQGLTGPNGIQGLTGPNGIQGPTGANGIQGIPGPNGIVLLPKNTGSTKIDVAIDQDCIVFLRDSRIMTGGASHRINIGTDVKFIRFIWGSELDTTLGCIPDVFKNNIQIHSYTDASGLWRFISNPSDASYDLYLNGNAWVVDYPTFNKVVDLAMEKLSNRIFLTTGINSILNIAAADYSPDEIYTVISAKDPGGVLTLNFAGGLANYTNVSTVLLKRKDAAPVMEAQEIEFRGSVRFIYCSVKSKFLIV